MSYARVQFHGNLFNNRAINTHGYGTTIPTREIKSLLGSLLLQDYNTIEQPLQTQIANAITELQIEV